MTKKTRVAINGFGRIGRVTFKNLIRRDDIEVVAINDLTDSNTLAHLLKYDSIHGRFPFEVTAESNAISAKGIRVPVFAEKDPTLLPWGQMQVDVVLECTGRFTDSKSASMHLAAGAKKVILSAPAKDAMKTVVLGVNDHLLTKDDLVISNASCTTNNAAPMIMLLDEAYGVESA